MVKASGKPNEKGFLPYHCRHGIHLTLAIDNIYNTPYIVTTFFNNLAAQSPERANAMHDP